MDLDSIIMAFALIGLSWCSYHLYREFYSIKLNAN